MHPRQEGAAQSDMDPGRSAWHLRVPCVEAPRERLSMGLPQLHSPPGSMKQQQQQQSWATEAHQFMDPGALDGVAASGVAASEPA